MTQRELAGAQLSISYVSLLEAGKRTPTPQTIQILADALSCGVDELAGEGEAGQPLALVLAQADLALEAGQVTAALERYDRVLAAAPEDAGMMRRARVGQAQALHRAGRLTEAADAFERCARLAEADPASEASLQTYVSWCRCLYELGELARAADVGKTALAEFDAVQARESELSIHLIATVAAIWYELGDLRQAEKLLDDGLQRASQLHSPTARGAILWNASLVAHERGRFHQALELSQEALSAFRGSDKRRYVGKLLNTRGYLLLRSDPPRPAEALAALTEALDHVADNADPVDKAYALTELCYAHLALGDTGQAVQAAEEARRLLGPTTQLEYARAVTALAVARTAAGHDDKARALFTEAASILESVGATRQAARTWVELAHALTDGGHVQEALTAYDKAVRAVNLAEPRWRHHRPGA